MNDRAPPATAVQPTMSAIGPKQTWASAPHMSAFSGKADMETRGAATARSMPPLWTTVQLTR